MINLLVSVNGNAARSMAIQPRTSALAPGVLCDVGIDGRFCLCLIERIANAIITVRKLPEPPLHVLRVTSG